MLKLVPDQVDTFENVFTLVVGRNGLGKSRLLADICRHQTRHFGPDTPKDVAESHPKTIAVSTGVFDRFPSSLRKFDPRSQNRSSNYTYLGVRREFMGSAGVVSLLSNATRGLLRQVGNASGLRALAHTFNTVDCHPFVRLIFKSSFRSLGQNRQLSLKDPLSDDAGRLVDMLGEVDTRVLSDFEALEESGRLAILDAASKLQPLLNQRSVAAIGLDFVSGSVVCEIPHGSDDLATSLALLLDAGLIRLMDLELYRINGESVSLRRASSGEQCLLTIILGVAGHLTDGSTVLIDEPEISLHPAWQERFMELLVAAVSGFHGCQFVIATHSPQLTSRLPTRSCFVMSLSRRELHSANAYANKSADVQLAELFDAPGAQNEYVARLAFNLLAKIRAAKHVAAEHSEQLDHLQHLASFVAPGEPLVELINSIAGVARYYGENP